jgi:hypothetical protein
VVILSFEELGLLIVDIVLGLFLGFSWVKMLGFIIGDEGLIFYTSNNFQGERSVGNKSVVVQVVISMGRFYDLCVSHIKLFNIFLI